ncbi:hypothetical protein XA68_12704 [Ophiocordyceps unilateralis]|uniref:PHD-type domain-containing protein n=1 Tax=Ophiocordyceps unilateralis TaxID=268505 RepID=A0A2A9PP24_OPHUN|nr:hypothetical protein XA68_12704 [Ophiocordyceps unilateralis]
MSEHHLSASFGDPIAQPQTPRQTPTLVTFPSPSFDTPKPYQGSFVEPGGLTPRFAEEYSVFNSTPGNLRGSQGPFAEFLPPIASTFSRGHKRLLSAESHPFDVPPHASHLATNVEKSEPTCHLPLSPPGQPPPSVSTGGIQPSPDLARSSSLKKCRKHSDARPSQVLSPPPSSNKGGRKLAPKLTMLSDHPFCQTDLVDPAQHDMSAVLMGHSGDLFGYPLSAPASASSNYWDPSMSMPMDLEFNAAVHGVMHPSAPSSHRHTGSFDWNADITMFQDVSAPVQSQDNAQSPRQERVLAPKPAASAPTANPVTLEDPFGIMNPGDGVDPGLLFGRPHTSALDSGFGSSSQPRPAERAAPSFAKPMPGELRRANSAQGPRSAKLTDRASIGSPIKSKARPGLSRSCSETRGRRAVGRTMQPAPMETNLSHGVLPAGCRPTGRCSPPKTVPRVSSLASIPETSPQYRPRTSVRFTIDSRGRARAETTVVGEGPISDKRLHRSRSAAASRSWDSSDDDSSDDEPIIIPSRNSSFNASYALPDPCKPVGSIFHTSCRSGSDRSRSNSATGPESEAETVVNDKGGDAMRELRKVVEDRQKRSRRMVSGRPQGLISTNMASFPGGIISPTSLADSSQGNGVRCVCEDTSTDEADGFMLQCESCEMWLHGKCINVTKRSMPRVYICCFCANTGRRCRDNGLGIAGLLSPLANKSYRTFR